MRLALELLGKLHRDLVRYAAVLGAQTGQSPVAPEKLVAPMLARLMGTDRAFAKARRGSGQPTA